MDAIVERTVRDCMTCQTATSKASQMPLKMIPLPGETIKEIAAYFYGPLPSGEYLLLVTCKYLRYPFIETMMSTSARSVIPKFEGIFLGFA